MPLNDTELRYYDSNVLRLPTDKRSEYHQQVDRLIDHLRKKIKEHTSFKIVKVIKAGSFAKYTILRKTYEDPIDVDVVFYLEGEDVDAETYEGLSQQIYDFLIAAYPSKTVEQFTIQKRAATVVFTGSGLTVDVVPVIAKTDQPGYGWQFSIDGSKTLTCAPGQIKFIKDRKDIDGDFRTLVRLGKKWRNRHADEIKALKSFTVELIMAYLLDRDGKGKKLEQRLMAFFLYIAQSELKEVIAFSENTGTLGTFADPVVIIDPVNNHNNVAARIVESERQAIVKKASETWETAHFASAENDSEVWKEIFGPRFKVED
ncbi:MAG TPA: CBASS oligonucleotide cyclase [Pyrinomonadaceae bacterium]|nr:CBASS oligonucleotide cyclase [Pyrinomonadaceae bacterium]